MLLTGMSCVATGIGALFTLGRYSNTFSKVSTSGTDRLVGGIYLRRAGDPKDMAYGMWAVLRKTGAVNLPEPTYTRELREITWTLTVHVIQTTHSLAFLPLAAAQGQPGVPSWVPDWWANEKQKWTSDHGLPGTNTEGWSLLSEETVEKVRIRESTEKVLSLDQTCSVLTVRTRDLNSICDSVSFRKTSDTHREMDVELHLSNVRAMNKCVEWTFQSERTGRGRRTDAQDQFNWFSRAEQTFDLRAILPSKIEGKDLPEHVLKRWATVYASKTRRASLEHISKAWTDGHAAPTWFHEFWKTQILVCNLLASYRKVGCGKFSAHPNKLYLTTCSHDTQVGDRILRVWGLQELLVVRCISGPCNSVKIVSPLKMSLSYNWTYHSDQAWERRASLLSIGYIEMHLAPAMPVSMSLLLHVENHLHWCHLRWNMVF
jgi:hypothetical protein